MALVHPYSSSDSLTLSFLSFALSFLLIASSLTMHALTCTFEESRDPVPLCLCEFVSVVWCVIEHAHAWFVRAGFSQELVPGCRHFYRKNAAISC